MLRSCGGYVLTVDGIDDNCGELKIEWVGEVVAVEVGCYVLNCNSGEL
jgi:hypothetical protein